MVRTVDCTAATASGDTTRTSIGTVTLPSSAKKIVGVGAYIAGGGAITTAEPISGIFEVESQNFDVKPAKFPLDIQSALTSGAVAFSPTIWPVDWSKNVANAVVTFYVTMDMALTVNSTGRGIVVYDKSD